MKVAVDSRPFTPAVLALCVSVACGETDHGYPRAPAFTVEHATQLLTTHTDALATGDTTRIRPFWSERSLSRDGFWFMHSWVGGRLEVAEWPEFLEQFDFEVTDVRDEGRYRTIHLKWRPVEGNANIEAESMVYYVIREDSRWKLINPIDVLTADWLSRETECLMFRYPPDIDIGRHLPELEEMDRECARAAEALELEREAPVEFYVAHTPEEVGRLLTQPPAFGLAALSYQHARRRCRGFPLAVSTTFHHPHEMMHLFQAMAEINEVNAAITEGFAVALGGGAVSTAELAVAEAGHLLGTPSYIPLDDLLHMSDRDFLRANYVTYFEAGAFVKFLMERHGLERFRAMTNGTTSPRVLESTITSVYGRTIEQLETEWHAHLLDQTFPRVGATIPSDASLLFSMTDPVGDDVGDGDYAYPNERFRPGVFDLTGFEVFKDARDVYFRLRFATLTAPVTYSSRGERFVPGTTIAIKKGAGSGRMLREVTHGVRFETGSGYDIELNVGTAVSLSNNLGKVYFTTGAIRENIADTSANTIEFSLPIELVGDPYDDWEYFVGVGLATDRTMTFLYGGPVTVHASHPVFITGGDFERGNPAFIDILLPEEEDQAEVLGDYDAGTGRLALVPMVSKRRHPGD